MDPNLHSPEVTHLSWGRLETEDGTFKDARLYPGGSREWDWDETGTRHIPGIQPSDVEELLEHGATTVVLGRGFYGRLEVCPETLAFLETRGITVHAGDSESAVRIYNELREKVPVGALVHSTC